MKKIIYHPKPGTTNFFLMPEKNILCDGKPFCCEGRRCDSLVFDETCKEEAIKNGEIVNPKLLIHEELKNGFLYKSDLDRYSILKNLKLEPLKDGDTFDLPKGLKIEKEIVNNCGLQHFCETCYGTCKEGYKTFIRLAPIEGQYNAKEETQDELWKDVFEFFDEPPKDQKLLIQVLSGNFTITRKEK